MPFQGVIINKENTGRINPVKDFDKTALLMLVMPDLTGLEMSYGEKIRLIQISDAEKLGLNAGYDSVNSVLAYYHIQEFFRIAPEGILYIVPLEKALISAMAAATGLIDFNVRVIGISDYTAQDELEKDVLSAQAIVEGSKQNLIHVSSVVIGALDRTKDLRTYAAENVSVVVGKDPFTDNIVPLNTLACIGSVLGGMCVRQVSENLGSVNINRKPDGFVGTPDYSLTNEVTNKFITSSFTDNILVSTITPVLVKDLTARGYIFPSYYIGYPGIFFNSSPTCTNIESDYAYAERNATWDKAAILVRYALIPQIKSKLPKRDGKIIPTKLQELKNIALASLKSMFDSEELDAAEIVIDPNQTVSETIPLAISIKVTVGDILHEIKIALAVVNEL